MGKKFFLILIFIVQYILFISGFSFGAKLYFSPESGNFKMLCPISVEVKLDHQGGESYGTRLDVIFNPLNIISTDISFSRSGLYNMVVQDEIGDSPTRLITSAYNNPVNNRISGDNISLGSLDFETNSVTVTDTKLEIYANSFDPEDFSSDSSVLTNPTTDILTETGHGYYTFSAGTCDPDTEYPKDELYVSDINNTDKVRHIFGFNFFVRDGLDYTKDQPGYKTDNIILQDYYYGKNQADKSSGIDPNSIEIEFIYSDGSKVLFTGSNTWINLAGSGKTRDRKRRDYLISISPFGLNDFGIEKTMTFSGTVSDYVGHRVNLFYTFNNPIPPRISYISPNTGDENTLPETDIIIKFSDNRAGINPESIEVQIYSGGCTGILIGYFSGNDIYKEALSGYANTPDYMIRISSGSVYQGKEFILPTNQTEICVKVKAEDNQQNKIITPNDTYSFITRNQCGFYDCENVFEIYRNPNSLTGQIFSLPIMYITGGKNPYISNNTLYCGILGNLTLITGNIQSPTKFKEDTLYISGGVATLSGEVLTIIPLYNE